MYSSLGIIFSFVAATVVVVPVIVTGKPQIHLGGIWIGKASESSKDNLDAPPKPPSVSTATQEGELKVISTPNKDVDFTGYIQLQVFLRKTNSDEIVKVHDSNSSFAISNSFPASTNSKSGISKKCEGEEKIMYEANGKCYQPGPIIPGIDSHCSDDFEQFVELYDKPGYGECFCVDYKDTTYRPVVHWEKSNRCYWLYDQGPCEKGQWLVYSNSTDSDGEKSLTCATRTCPENTDEDRATNFPRFWFEHQGKCLKTESHNVEFCGEEKKKIYLQSDKPEPICADRRPISSSGVKGLASGANSLSCKAGHKKLLSGDCKRVASFE